MAKFDFPEKNDSNAINILSLTDIYPSAVQPWMINHLIQIEKNGGQNLIVNYGSDDFDFDAEVKDFQLASNYTSLGTTNSEIITNFLKRNATLGSFSKTVSLYNTAEKKSTLKKNLHQLFTAYPFKADADIVHSHSEGMAARYLNLIKARNLPLIHTFHGQAPIGVPTVTALQRKELTRYVRAVLVNTKFAMEQYKTLGAEGCKFEIIPQGIDLQKWPFFPIPAPSKSETLNLLTVGRIVPEKGHSYVIDAIKNLSERGLNISYHIVGRGPEKSVLEEKVKELGIKSNVIFHGTLTGTALKEVYKTCHMFVLPSLKGTGETWEETQGVVIQEAQASGKIVFATKTGGIPECIVDNVNGFLVPDRNSSYLASKILEVLEAPEKWKYWQENGRSWVSENYDCNYIGKKVYKLYEEYSVR